MASKAARQNNAHPERTIGFRLRPEDVAAVEFLEKQTEWKGISKSDIFRSLLLREAADLGGPAAASSAPPRKQAPATREDAPAAASLTSLPPVPELPQGAVPPAGHELLWLLAARPVGADGAPLVLSPSTPAIEPPSAASSHPAPAAAPPPAAATEAAAPAAPVPSAPAAAPRKAKATRGKAIAAPSAANKGPRKGGRAPEEKARREMIRGMLVRYREANPTTSYEATGAAAGGLTKQQVANMKAGVGETADFEKLYSYLAGQGIEP